MLPFFISLNFAGKLECFKLGDIYVLSGCRIPLNNASKREGNMMVPSFLSVQHLFIMQVHIGVSRNKTTANEMVVFQ